MILTDKIKQSCAFSEIVKRLPLTFNHRYAATAYCEALVFITGMHPKGRYANIEGETPTYSAGETEILVINQYTGIIQPQEFIIKFILAKFRTAVYIADDPTSDIRGCL